MSVLQGMSGSGRPLTVCSGDCAAANGCVVGGCHCPACGGWYCKFDMVRGPYDEDVCVECVEEMAEIAGDEDEDGLAEGAA